MTETKFVRAEMSWNLQWLFVIVFWVGLQCAMVVFLFSFFLPLRLNPRGGHQKGIPEYQVLSGLVETK